MDRKEELYLIRRKEVLRRRRMHWKQRIMFKSILKQSMAEICNKQDEFKNH